MCFLCHLLVITNLSTYSTSTIYLLSIFSKISLGRIIVIRVSIKVYFLEYNLNSAAVILNWPAAAKMYKNNQGFVKLIKIDFR